MRAKKLIKEQKWRINRLKEQLEFARNESQFYRQLYSISETEKTRMQQRLNEALKENAKMSRILKRIEERINQEESK